MIKYIILLFSITRLFSEEYKFYECMVAKGDFNYPVWSEDNHTFSIEEYNYKTNGITLTDLFAYRINECETVNIDRIEALEKKKEKKKKKNGIDPNKYRQAPIGWLSHSKLKHNLLFFKTGKRHTIYESRFSLFPKKLTFNDKKGTGKKKILNSKGAVISSFLTNGNILYFLSENNQFNIFSWEYNIPDMKMVPNIILDDKEVEDIPIISFDISSQKDRIIFVQHLHNSSKVVVGENNNGYYTNLKELKLPDRNYTYSNAYFDYNNSNKYIILSANEDLDKKNKAKIHLFDDSTSSEQFISFCYKHKANSNKYITQIPSYQWNPKTSDIFFVSEDGKLKYWSAGEIKNANIKIDTKNERIKLFQFSKDSKYVVVVTTQNMHIFEVEIK